MKKIIYSISVAAVLSASPPVFTEESGVTITPMLGHNWYLDDAQLDDDLTASIALGYKFASPYAIELAYLSSNPGVEGMGDSVDLEEIRLDALAYFADGQTRPFAVVGMGVHEIDFNGVNIDEPMLNAGLGLKAKITDALSFRSDFRGVFVGGDNDHPADLYFALNLGVQWLIGGSSKPAPSAPKKTMDSDNDGIKDSIDNCPATPAGTKVDATGCAMVLDDDKDGVINSLDECPDTEKGAKVDKLGCYVVISEDVTVSLNVNFANNSDEILSGVDQIVKVASFMKEYPLTNVIIEGHTDSAGSEAYNQSLSQRRAQAVANALISKYNVASSRVSAVGYGETKPIADNDTAEGRAENRRVSAVVKASVEKVVK